MDKQHANAEVEPRYPHPARAAGADALTVWQRLQQQAGRTPTAPLGASTQKLTEQFELRKAQRSQRKRQLQRGLLGACAVLLFLVFLVGAEAYVAAHPSTTVHVAPSELAFAEELGWIAPEARAELAGQVEASLQAQLEAQELVDEEGRVALLARDALPRLRKAFKASPWVHSVAQLRIEPAGRLHTQLRLRRPQAAAETSQGVVLLDDQGVVLPLTFTDAGSFRRFNEQLEPPLRLLTGLTAQAQPPLAGQTWEHAAVQAGLAVDGMLAPFAKRVPIFAVDVSNVGGARSASASEITLLALAPAGHLLEIAWGRDPAHAKYGESPVGAKLARLERLLERDPELQDHERIDLRFATLDGR